MYKVQGDTVTGKPMVDRFGVRAYPTFVALNAQGELLHSWLGYGQPEPWVKRMQEIKADPISVDARKSRHDATPTFRDALVLGQVALGGSDYVEAERRFQEASDLDPEAAGEENVPIQLFRAAYFGAGTGDVTIEHAVEVATGLLESPDVKPAHVLEVTERLARAVDKIGTEMLVPFLQMAHPQIEPLEDEDLQSRREKFLIEYALFAESDTEKAVRMKKGTLPDGWESDPDELNGFAWWCFERKVNLEEAEALAQNGVDLTPPGSSQANVIDTLAQIVYLRGDQQRATELIRQALEMDPENEYLKEQIKKFTGVSESHM
ncbi:hypothetical protein ACFL6M_00860 [Candidatus Eisenbacteria bacterium]|uniref:Thioredoxin domain-containing protein n=1 Tax=Eiseniibacteriota bacterium TaxID=2212470 RepID=A0ABV6YIF6_UNCEI